MNDRLFREQEARYASLLRKVIRLEDEIRLLKRTVELLEKDRLEKLKGYPGYD